MEKACSYCATTVHNSSMCLTCNNSTPVCHGLKLFGVHLDTSEAAISAMKKSSSVECLSPSSSLSSRTLSNVSHSGNPSKFSSRYLSDSLNRHPQNRKKGVPWTEDEHVKFLAGLAKLGKGDWKGISKHFVQSRTPTQVASHAQKYFLKQNMLKKKREMPSLFTMQTENNKQGHLNAPRNTHGHTTDISEALWMTYAKRYYYEAFLRQTSNLQAPMRSLIVSSLSYNSNGLSIYPKCNYDLKSVEAKPNLELTLAVEVPKKRDSKNILDSLEPDLRYRIH